jgi:hypothetical protein
MLLTGEMPNPEPERSPFGADTPFGRGPYGDHSPDRSRDRDQQWQEPSSPDGGDGFDPNDPEATAERIEMLMSLVASEESHRTEECKYTRNRPVA